jgi:hypothetical protein
MAWKRGTIVVLQIGNISNCFQYIIDYSQSTTSLSFSLSAFQICVIAKKSVCEASAIFLHMVVHFAPVETLHQQ